MRAEGCGETPTFVMLEQKQQKHLVGSKAYAYNSIESYVTKQFLTCSQYDC